MDSEIFFFPFEIRKIFFFLAILALEPQPSFDEGAESLWHAAQQQVPHCVNGKLKEGETLPPWLPTNMCAVHLRRL
jgi:hypothetical protein